MVFCYACLSEESLAGHHFFHKVIVTIANICKQLTKFVPQIKPIKIK